MKIVSLDCWIEEVPLQRAYAIAGHYRSAVTLYFVRLKSDGPHIGLGSASPSPRVTGESEEACRGALEAAAAGCLVGATLGELADLADLSRRLTTESPDTPAACAALDMALWDLLGHSLERPVAELLGHSTGTASWLTSITIGIQSIEQTLDEAREYVGRGFHCLKVKLGDDVAEDIERLRRLRETVGGDIAIRADANEGYDAAALRLVLPLLETLDIEFLEQPLSRSDEDQLEQLTSDERRRLALDESVQRPVDAERWEMAPGNCGTWVVKLMKCGGISPAVEIAKVAQRSGTALMWGCMDESVISIAAALHAATASPATRYLDLDGSFELAKDPAVGGFHIQNGRMQLAVGPGLGVRL